jgi:hypothetical protein
MTFCGIKSRRILSRRAVAEDTFSADYITARRRFRNVPADCHVLPISASGPNGAELSIDIAVLGSRTPRRVAITRTPTLSKEDNLLLFINYSGFIKMDVLSLSH